MEPRTAVENLREACILASLTLKPDSLPPEIKALIHEGIDKLREARRQLEQEINCERTKNNHDKREKNSHRGLEAWKLLRGLDPF